MATDAGSEDFVTIVPVGESRPSGPPAIDPAFVTVLTVGAFPGAAKVVICRPRGARLGLGLKFEGGSAAAEKVRRLLVQSCAEDSPAANASTPWGKLIPGDEILAIDGISVSDLTRIDCVRRLKDSDETLRLLVRHFETEIKNDKKNMELTENVLTKQTEIVRPTTLPPPVPPRKLGKKNSFKEKTCLQTVGEQNGINTDGIKEALNGKESVVNMQPNGPCHLTKLSRKSSFDSHIHRQTKESIACLKKGSPEEVRRLVRRLSDGKTIPPEAEVYIDLLSSEWERCLLFGDAESDDTGSSISTVVDRLGSMASSVENSIPSTPIMQPKTIDIQKVLNSIENIDSDILKDLTTKRFMEKTADTKFESHFKTNGTNERANFHSEETIQIQKKIQPNDRNNNTTALETFKPKADKPKSIDEVDNKSVTVVAKPKPLPRSKVERSHSERKPRPIVAPEQPPPPVPEPLLTPTKKTCIETWLQRSEAEMNNKTIEKVEELAPEALPRLIDFVPKPQYKDTGNDSSLPRPTTAPPPPPPPAESREDGSGASLDTIGELDESSDVTDNAKTSVAADESIKRKSSFESSFWEDRGLKSDAEDKSLSNDETPLPTCPRQPPDGVETPSDVVEKIPDLPSRLPPRLPAGWLTSRSRSSYASRLQDARSEASVKDKIAMFSNETASSDQLDKCGTLPTKMCSTTRKSSVPYTANYSDVSSLDRRLTKSQENLDEVPRIYNRTMDRPEVLGSINTAENKSLQKSSRAVHVESKPLFYGSTTTLPRLDNPTFVSPTYHTRSISEDNSEKHVHKSNLEYLIEQRKKSMSKLRGLLIPEVQGPVVDLPEIKVQDNIKSFIFTSSQRDYNKKDNKPPQKVNSATINEAKWKANLLPNNIPKYSPAFKRKSLQVYTPTSLSKESTPERKFSDRVDSISKLNNLTNGTKPYRSSLDYKIINRTQNSTLPSNNSSVNAYKLNYKDTVRDAREYKNVEIKICTTTDIVDSDNDSAMSSTQSSYRSSASSPMHNLDTLESDSSHLSPRIPHYPSYSLVKTELPTKTSMTDKCDEYVKRNVCRSISSDTNVSLSSSAGSAATSGSQASCSSLESSVADSDKKRVSKPYNIDTINRRNILASAKCRSGKDANIHSPVVETKFSHDESDRSPSPTNKVSERLSTLTSSVSAIANKGESRRRNKVIAESDSDSDSELNVRQRKADFKNSRLKRNPSSGKNKQIESKPESPKSEDAPQVISEKIIKEIKKAGLDNYGVKPLIPEKKTVEMKKLESKVLNKEVKVVTNALTTQHKTAEVECKPQIVRKQAEAKTDSSTHDSSNKASTRLVRLKRGTASGVGLILAGGIDCEAKDVTVHRVLADSVAAKAGLKRGVKVRSINGCTMAGLTHAQSVAILKEQRSEVVIEIENETTQNGNGAANGLSNSNTEAKSRNASTSVESTKKSTGCVVTVSLEKAGGGAGLGFGLDGGRDSPAGDKPLTIKKLFAGGAAAQSGRIVVGAELLSAGGHSMEGFTRTQAWAALKALPAGTVALVLRNPTTSV